MFQPGEYIHHATSGLCRVDEITKLDLSGSDHDRLYYKLTPVDVRGSTVYTPVDNHKVAMRPVITTEQAKVLIQSIPSIEAFHSSDDKVREQMFKEAIHSVDCRDWVRVIKTLYERKQSRLSRGKKTTSTDEKYFRSAQDKLHGEIAFALGMRKEDVEGYIEKLILDDPVPAGETAI